jgi:hypothetical protein
MTWSVMPKARIAALEEQVRCAERRADSWEQAAKAAIRERDSLLDVLADETNDRRAFHGHYLEAQADADALRGEHA